jgi:hypothetical protein
MTVGHYLDVGNHASEIKTVGLLVKVLVVVDLQTRVLEDWDVVAPSRGGNIDLLAGLVPPGKELSTNTKSTCT